MRCTKQMQRCNNNVVRTSKLTWWITICVYGGVYYTAPLRFLCVSSELVEFCQMRGE